MTAKSSPKSGREQGLRPFDDAMRRLVRVPKEELDAEEAKYKKMRQRLKDKKAKRKPAR
jgi:hypothetical protein